MAGFGAGLLKGLAGGINAKNDRELRQRELSVLDAMGQARGQPGVAAPGMGLPMSGGDVAAVTGQGGSRTGRMTGGGSSNAGGGSPDRRKYANMVYNAFLEEGFSPSQARALTAEINRENSFNPRYLFGSHADPHNRATNVGILSWQGSRATNAMNFLRERGVVGGDGRIMQTPEAIRAQAAFLRHEMETIPAYARTRERFLANPDVDYDTAHTVLGDNFIRWRRTDPVYRDSGYGRINEGYRLVDQGKAKAQPAAPAPEAPPQKKPAAAPQTWGWVREMMTGAGS